MVGGRSFAIDKTTTEGYNWCSLTSVFNLSPNYSSHAPPPHSKLTTRLAALEGNLQWTTNVAKFSYGLRRTVDIW